MPKKLEELIGIFTYERVRFAGEGDAYTVVGQLEGGQTVIGDVTEGDLVEGQSYRFFGRWTEHFKYGPQFRFRVLVKHAPSSRRGFCAYLRSVCTGLGQVLAERLFDAYGQDTIRILKDEPARAVREIQHLSAKVANKASVSLKADSRMTHCKIDLMDLLSGRGFPKATITECIERWGSGAPERIKRDPFILMTSGIRGCGFLRCDRLYLELGLSPHKVKRQAMCVWYTLNSDTQGHTWHPIQKVIEGLKSKVGSAQIQPKKALRVANNRLIKIIERDGNLWVADKRKADDEEAINRLLDVLVKDERHALSSRDARRSAGTNQRQEEEAAVPQV